MIKFVILDSSAYNTSQYVETIKEKLENDEHEFVLVSTHKHLIESLINECIYPVIVVPNVCLLYGYVYRIHMRGDTRVFMDTIISDWYKFHYDIRTFNNKLKIYELGSNEYLKDVIDLIHDQKG